MKNPRKRRWASNPMNLLMGHAPIQKDKFEMLDAEARLAWEKMRSGVGDAADWEVLADVCNMCGIRASNIGNGQELVELCKKAAESIEAMRSRYQTTKKYGPCHMSLQHIPDLLDFHAELLRNSTPVQMIEALEKSREQIHSKKLYL